MAMMSTDFNTRLDFTTKIPLSEEYMKLKTKFFSRILRASNVKKITIFERDEPPKVQKKK